MKRFLPLLLFLSLAIELAPSALPSPAVAVLAWTPTATPLGPTATRRPASTPVITPTPTGTLWVNARTGVSVERWRPLIERHARRKGLEPALVAAVVYAESKGVPDAHNPSGAVGLMQIMSRDALYYRPPAEWLRHPGRNVAYGTNMLRSLIASSWGDQRKALAAYNCGWTALHENRCGPLHGWTYADWVLWVCQEFGGCR